MQNTNQVSDSDKNVVIQYNMTNDYMFRYILQKNEKVLRGLICALLHLKPEDVKSVEIRNPIDLSQNIIGKDFVLDIKILMNNNQLLNLEMQVKNEFNWTDRSLTYLCRAFDQLQSGQAYEDTLPVVHIGFTDFTLFPDSPEFYSSYRMINIRNHAQVYSDKFTLSVVVLTQIDREQCRAREDALRRERTLERDKNRLLAENASLQAEIALLRKQLDELQSQTSK